MNQKWNLQDIRPVENKHQRIRRRPKSRQTVPTDEQKYQSTEKVSIQKNPRSGIKKTLAVISIFIFIIIGAVAISIFNTGAQVTVALKNQTPTINASFTAFPEPRSQELSYEILLLEDTAERQVTSSGSESRQEHATGLIEIIKTTPGTQTLVQNTRFQTEEGLIFRIAEEVLVPGSSQDDDGETTPGTIRVEVRADNPGEEYNISSETRLTIPGFAENNQTELFNSVYATSRTDFTGGFDGESFIVADDDLREARQEMQQQHRNDLLDQISDNLPNGFMYFDSSVSFQFTQLPTVNYGDDLATIKETATLHVPIFNKEEFSSFIATNAIPVHDGEPVMIDDFSELTFSYTDAGLRNANLESQTSLEFQLTGRPHVIWTINEVELSENIAGNHKDILQQVVREFSAIESATAVIRPFYSNVFPEDTNLIEIITNFHNN